jgi:hypothetical protein
MRNGLRSIRPGIILRILWGGPPGPRATPTSACRTFSDARKTGPGGPARSRGSALHGYWSQPFGLSASLQLHIRNDVEVRSTAGSVVL